VTKRVTPVLVLSFLLGWIAGLRSLTAPAIVCWAAHFGWLHLDGTKLALINHPITLIVVSSAALVELIVDKLPQIPARTAPVGLIARGVLGAACGIALATSMRTSPLLGGVVASAGAIVGAFAGYQARHALVWRMHLPDFAVALAEDALAIAAGLLIVAYS
jgi:uncharacterized membrane protein